MIKKITSKIIQSRKSIFPKDFTGELIEKDVVMQLLENANYAPTHKLTQPWIFKIFSQKSKNLLLNEIIKITPEISIEKKNKLKNKIEKSSHIICICMKKNNSILPEWEEIAATSMAVQNLWLSCYETKIGGYWSTPKYIASLNDFLSLKNDEVCLGLFYLGVHNVSNFRKTNRKNISEKVKWYD